MKEHVASQASRNISASSGRPACPWAQSTRLDSPRPCLSGPPPLLQQRLAPDEAPAVFLPLTSLLPKLLEEKNFLPLPSIKLGPDGGKEGRGVVGSLWAWRSGFPPSQSPKVLSCVGPLACFVSVPSTPSSTPSTAPSLPWTTRLCPAASHLAHLENSTGHLSPSLGTRA